MTGSLDNGIYTSVIIDCEKYPEIFENYYNYSAYPYGACLYFGEKMLFDEINFAEDEGNIFYNNEDLQTYIANNDKTIMYGSDGHDSRINEKYALHTTIIFEQEDAIYSTISGIPNGTPVHFIGVYRPIINENGIIHNSEELKFIYIDGVWNVEE